MTERYELAAPAERDLEEIFFQVHEVSSPRRARSRAPRAEVREAALEFLVSRVTAAD